MNETRMEHAEEISAEESAALFHPGVSRLAMIDTESEVSRKARVYSTTKLFCSRVGDYSYICPGTQLTCAEVGKFCSVATGCLIGLAGHNLQGISTSPVFTERDNPSGSCWTEKHEENVLRPVTIGNDVWIGVRVIILGGVKIGNGAVIGAGSVVTRDVPPYAVVAGAPARLIRYRFEEPVIRRLEELQWWNKSEEELRQLLPLFQKESFTLSDLEKLF